LYRDAKYKVKKASKMRRARWLTWLGGALVIGGATLLGTYFFLQHSAETVQRDAEEWLKRNAKPQLPEGKMANALPRRLSHGDVVGKLTIPRLRLSVMVLEGDDGDILKIGAGHIPATALPQGSGNVAIAAHRDTYFRPLRFIRPSDAIVFTTPQGTSEYRVTQTEVVRPSEIAVLANAPGRDLTLVTCYPFYYLGRAPKRFVVHAKKIA
jgi:sortase A